MKRDIPEGREKKREKSHIGQSRQAQSPERRSSPSLTNLNSEKGSAGNLVWFSAQYRLGRMMHSRAWVLEKRSVCSMPLSGVCISYIGYSHIATLRVRSTLGTAPILIFPISPRLGYI